MTFARIWPAPDGCPIAPRAVRTRRSTTATWKRTWPRMAKMSSSCLNSSTRTPPIASRNTSAPSRGSTTSLATARMWAARRPGPGANLPPGHGRNRCRARLIGNAMEPRVTGDGGVWRGCPGADGSGFCVRGTASHHGRICRTPCLARAPGTTRPEPIGQYRPGLLDLDGFSAGRDRLGHLRLCDAARIRLDRDWHARSGLLGRLHHQFCLLHWHQPRRDTAVRHPAGHEGALATVDHAYGRVHHGRRADGRRVVPAHRYGPP